jgi:hypothetical protein
VNGLDDPVDARITADRLVLRVDKDDLVVLVGRVLVDPVRIEDTEIGAASTDTLLGSCLERTLVLELVNSVVGGLACRVEKSSLARRYSGKPKIPNQLHTVGGTLGSRALAATTSHANTVDDISLLSLVAETAGLVGARWAGCTVDDIELTELY